MRRFRAGLGFWFWRTFIPSAAKMLEGLLSPSMAPDKQKMGWKMGLPKGKDVLANFFCNSYMSPNSAHPNLTLTKKQTWLKVYWYKPLATTKNCKSGCGAYNDWSETAAEHRKKCGRPVAVCWFSRHYRLQISQSKLHVFELRKMEIVPAFAYFQHSLNPTCLSNYIHYFATIWESSVNL